MANRKNILCIVGSRNQTTQLHEIAKFLEDDYNVYYSQLFGEGILYRAAAEIGFLIIRSWAGIVHLQDRRKNIYACTI